jgi:hypothetical protein
MGKAKNGWRKDFQSAKPRRFVCNHIVSSHSASQGGSRNHLIFIKKRLFEHEVEII